MLNKSQAMKVKLCVAHYRRAQPMFKNIKELIDEKAIGEIKFVQLKFLKPALSTSDLEIPKTKWRVDPSIAGGGLFHDLAPHQLDLMIFFFGKIKSSSGISYNQQKKYNADDIVAGNILFESGVLFNGLWCFTVNESEAEDHVEIIGSKGSIKFGVFDHFEIEVERNGERKILPFEKIPHVQQPMIECVVEYFSGGNINPSPPEVGVRVMEVMESFTVPQH
jgi:predicted dehydrogenase